MHFMDEGIIARKLLNLLSAFETSLDSTVHTTKCVVTPRALSFLLVYSGLSLVLRSTT